MGDLVPDDRRGTVVAVSSVLFEAPVLMGPLLLTGLLAVGSSASEWSWAGCGQLLRPRRGARPAGVRVEAVTTVTATGIAGFASGTAAAGVIVDRAAPAGGFLAAALVALVAGGVVHTRRSALGVS